jgi:tetratricopeptide (TPR) repeat protein
MLRDSVAVLAAFLAPQEAPSDAPFAPAQHYAIWKQAEELRAKGDVRRAAPLLEELARRNPQDGSLALAAGECYLAFGRREQALPWLEKAYAGGWDARYDLAASLARICAQLGRRDEALSWIERALAHRYVDRPGLFDDPAFASLREDARFRGLCGRPDASGLDRLTGWKLDLEHYEAEVRRMHAHPDRPAEGEPFRAALAALRASLAQKSDAEVFAELQRITALLGDGHSVIYALPTPRIAFTVLPLQLYLFGDGCYVVRGAGDAEPLVGQEVVAIGGKPVAQLVRDVAPYVSRDNDAGILWHAPGLLQYVDLLRVVGAAKPAGPVELTVRAPGGEPRTVALAGTVARPEHGAFYGALPPPPSVSMDGAPLWLKRPDEPYWTEELPGDDLLYVQLNQIQHGPKQTLGEFAAEVRETLAETGFAHLVLDLRHNRGGNNFLITPLVRLAAWFEEESPDHRIFVITGRHTFSACQNLVNRLERNLHCVFAGEPSSSKPNFTGESTELRLPWSGLRGSISSRWWQDSFPEDERPFVAPKLPVTLSAADWLAGRDPVLDAIREAIAAGA